MVIDRVQRVRRRTFASLASPNYRFFFGGVIASTTGTWIQLIAENWLIIKLGGSGVALGVNTALQLLPIVVLGSHAGVLVDRWNRRRLVLVAQSLAGALALTMGLLTLTGVIRIWMVWVAALLVGCVDAFHSPARAAFSAELVGADLVANAVALTTAVTVSSRAIGPAIGGLLVAGVGTAACFLINAASYAVGAASILVMNPRRLKVEPPVPRARGQVVAGLRHVRQHPTLRGVLMTVAVVGVFGSNFQLLLTLLASARGHSPALYGVMMSCLGSGMLVGSLLAAGWHRPAVRGVGLLALAMGGGYLLTALTPGLAPALMAIAVLGVVTGMFMASASGALQVNAGPGMRGRIMALYIVASLGTAALGSPLIGWIAQTWNIQVGLVISAVSCLAACLVGRWLGTTRTGQPIPEPDGSYQA
jgi:MFS family permease